MWLNFKENKQTLIVENGQISENNNLAIWSHCLYDCFAQYLSSHRVARLIPGKVLSSRSSYGEKKEKIATSANPVAVSECLLLATEGQCDQKKSPNVYKSFPKMISLKNDRF